MPMPRRGGVGEGEDTGSITIHYDTCDHHEIRTHHPADTRTDCEILTFLRLIILQHLASSPPVTIRPAGMPLIIPLRQIHIDKQDLTLSRREITQIMTEDQVSVWSDIVKPTH